MDGKRQPAEEAMRRTIVIGFDGSEESRDALELGGRLAHLEDARAIVVACFAHSPTEIGEEAFESRLAEDSEPLFAEARRTLHGIDVSTLALGTRSAAQALHDVAEAEQAEAIVLGSTHRGAVGRIMPGSVGERLLDGAPCSVVVAPRGFARGQHFGFGVIGVAYDGTEESKIALDEGRRLAVGIGGTLRLIRAAIPASSAKRGEQVLAAREDDRRRLEQEAASVADSVDVEAVLVDGGPAAALADQGIELDLLVIGSRGYGPLRRTLLGGVSGEVMRTAPCPVWVTPRGTTDTSAAPSEPKPAGERPASAPRR
jgi:nucleotide-binding universal stress UspA family protein